MLLQTEKLPATKPLRILFALPGLHRVVRGAEVAFESVAREIARIPGYSVTLIGSGEERPGEPYDYRRARCIRREKFEKWPSLPYLRGHYVYEELTFSPGLWRSYSPSEFDITVTCGYPYASWILRRGRKNGGPKHVFVTQNGDWVASAGNWEFKHFSCDGLVCTNPQYYERQKNRFRSVLIPNGVDPDLFHPGPADRAAFGLPEAAPVALMVSALIPSKRVVEGIRAAAKVPGLHLLIAGDGELRQEVASLGRELMPDRFHNGAFPRSRMPDLYRAADVFLHMSQDEPSANAYLEAMSSGLPIVAHDWEVVRWTMGGLGLLVDTNDLDAVAAALATGLKQRSESDIAARREMICRRFAWKSIAGDYCRFFQEVAAEGESPGVVNPGASALG
jgi:glycosyltransferase involved in cell wall biosynthesis